MIFTIFYIICMVLFICIINQDLLCAWIKRRFFGVVLCNEKHAHHSTVKAECESLHDCLDRIILLAYFIRQLSISVDCVIYSDAMNLIKLLESQNPKPLERHMLIELRDMQQKLNLDEREIRKLIVPLLSVKDSLCYFPEHPLMSSNKTKSCCRENQSCWCVDWNSWLAHISFTVNVKDRLE